MRVSSTLRIEAAKLFWADPDTYYLIESSWLLEGGFPGDVFYDSPFLAYVQNVEVEYGDLSDFKIGPIRDGVLHIRHGAVKDFWNTLKKRIPCVKRVVINHNWRPLTLEQQEKSISRCLQVLMESCPPEIDVAAFVLEEDMSTHTWQRSLYRSFVTGGKWKRISSSFDRKTILMPTKPFCGPVGKFQGLIYAHERIELQRTALGPLIIEALDRYHFSEDRIEPFSCPVSGCEAHFEQAGQCTIHTAKAHSDELMAWNRLEILPDKLKHVFEKHQRNIDRKGQELGKKRRRMYNEWNEGGKKRRAMESGWIDQLQNDEAWDTGQEPRDSKLWQWFSMVMNSKWIGQ